MTENCEQRIDGELNERIKDLRRLMEADAQGTTDEELGPLDEYGLSFDYISEGTFSDQNEAYFRYQLSWGGPSDEFRFFVNRNLNCHRIEYWFLDWFDGAHRVLEGKGRETIGALWKRFADFGLLHEAIRRAR